MLHALLGNLGILGKYNTLERVAKIFMPTLERAVEMGQKRNMVKAMMEGTEETRAAGKWSPWELGVGNFSISRCASRVTDT